MFIAKQCSGHMSYSREQKDRDPALRDLLFLWRRQSIRTLYHALEAKCHGKQVLVRRVKGVRTADSEHE